MTSQPTTYLAFDVGAQRIGVARAMVPPRIAAPLVTLRQTEALEQEIAALLQQEQPAALIVGLPRNQKGSETAQTEVARAWAARYLAPSGQPIIWQDESLTSVIAEQQLESYGKPFQKADIDALAAALILQDYLEGALI